MGAKRHARDEAWTIARDLVRAFGGDAADADRVALFWELFAFVEPRLAELLARWDRERTRLGRPPPNPSSVDTHLDRTVRTGTREGA